MKTEYKYYLGTAVGVYAVDESKPDEPCFFANSDMAKSGIEPIVLPIRLNCQVAMLVAAEKPSSIEEIRAKYPNFKPLSA